MVCKFKLSNFPIDFSSRKDRLRLSEKLSNSIYTEITENFAILCITLFEKELEKVEKKIHFFSLLFSIVIGNLEEIDEIFLTTSILKVSGKAKSEILVVFDEISSGNCWETWKTSRCWNKFASFVIQLGIVREKKWENVEKISLRKKIPLSLSFFCSSFFVSPDSTFWLILAT